MDRRYFVQLLKGASCTYMTLRITGCGLTHTDDAKIAADDANAVLVYDLIMDGYSTLGSGRLGENGTLKATQIRDFKPITLNYIQDADGHTFKLTSDDFRKLLKGQTVSVLTTVNNGHNHEVRIDPKNH